MLKLINHKVFPTIQNRVRITIPTDAHCITGGGEKSIEFIAYVTNPNPLSITVYKSRTAIYYQNVFITTDERHEETCIPKETQQGERIKLAIYYPLSNQLGLPLRNEGWVLQAKIYLRCYYGEWEYPINSVPFSISGPDWQNNRDSMIKMLNLWRDGS